MGQNEVEAMQAAKLQQQQQQQPDVSSRNFFLFIIH